MKSDYPNLEVNEWTAEYIENPDLYTPDREHLSNEGKEVFSQYIISCLNERGYNVSALLSS